MEIYFLHEGTRGNQSLNFAIPMHFVLNIVGLDIIQCDESFIQSSN